VGSGCRPKLWGPRKVARLFGERSNRPKSEAFAACGKTSRKGELRRGQPDALLAPDEVREIGKTDAPANAPNLLCFRRIVGLPLLPAESGTNRL